MARMILLPKKRRSPEERLRSAFAHLGYRIFILRLWFGRGFLAIRNIDDQLSAVIVRQLPSGAFELQMLEQPSTTTPQMIETVRKWSKVNFTLRPFPYNPTKRGYLYKWRYLVRIGELREAAQAEQGVLLPDAGERRRVTR